MSTSSFAISLPVTSEITRQGRVKPVDDTDSHSETKKLVEPMNELNQELDRPTGSRDDLQQIKGIGQTIAQALESLGIYRYADLADFTPDSLADLLKVKIPSISPQRIERNDWLGQARALAHSQQKPQTPQDEAKKIPVSSAQPHERNTKRTSKDNWRELGDFFVSFGYVINSKKEERLQTKVHYSQGDKFEWWDGIVTDKLVNWMLNQANLSALIDAEAQTEMEAPIERFSQAMVEETTLLELFLDLSNLWVSEVKMPVSVIEPSQATMLRAECRLSLSGPAARELTEDRGPFTIELYLVDTHTNQSNLVASYAGRLRPNELGYEIQQDFPIPPAGRYQLYLVAKLLPLGTAVTHLQGPIIRAEA